MQPINLPTTPSNDTAKASSNGVLSMGSAGALILDSRDLFETTDGSHVFYTDPKEDL